MLESISQDLLNKYLFITRQLNKVQELILREYSLAMDAHILMNAIQIHTTLDLPPSFCILEASWTIININNTELLVWLHRVLVIVSISKRLFTKISITQKLIFIIYMQNVIHQCILRNKMTYFQFINKNYTHIIKLHRVLRMSWDVLIL